MAIISEKDQRLVNFIRASIKMPDWNLAMAIRGFLTTEDYDKKFYSDGEPIRCHSESPISKGTFLYQCQLQNLHEGCHVYYRDNWKLVWW